MHFQLGAVLSLLLLKLASAGLIQQRELEQRDDVAAARALLIALQAQAFCSSFVQIADSTTTIAGPGTTTTSTVTAPTSSCTITVPGSTLTQTVVGATVNAAAFSTSIETSLTTVYTFVSKKRAAIASSTTTIKSAASTSSTASVMSVVNNNAKPSIGTTSPAPNTAARVVNTSPTGASTSTATQTKCSIRGIPPQAQIFVCDVIKQACLLLAKPKMKTVSVLSQLRYSGASLLTRYDRSLRSVQSRP